MKLNRSSLAKSLRFYLGKSSGFPGALDVVKSPAHSRFVILRHEVPPEFPRPSHWDLLLEHGEVALAWALDDLPAEWSAGGTNSLVTAVRLPDHRLYYLDYEGPISAGRGQVSRIFQGVCEWCQLQADQVQAKLACAAFTTQITLLDLGKDKPWQLRVERVPS
jgi:hypothetical protein